MNVEIQYAFEPIQKYAITLYPYINYSNTMFIPTTAVAAAQSQSSNINN